MRPYYLLSLLLLPLFAPPLAAQQFRWRQHSLPTTASLRGLHVVDDQTLWASGAGGALLRSTTAGEQWEVISPPDSLDFRSIWAFSAQEALIASAGQPARIYRTADGGASWQLVYTDTSGQAFFDAIQFWDDKRGLALSDPVRGAILLLRTEDGGMTWHPLSLPTPVEGEAFFAASNGSIATAGSQHAWIGTGGAAIRVLYTSDAGISWQLQTPPMERHSDAAGIYALRFANAKKGVAIGGAYDQPLEGRFAALYTTNGGKRWRLPKKGPAGYRSGLALVPGTNTYIAVGTNGSDVSRNGGRSWRPLNTHNLNTIRFSPSGQRGWAVGAKGTLFILEN